MMMGIRMMRMTIFFLFFFIDENKNKTTTKKNKAQSKQGMHRDEAVNEHFCQHFQFPKTNRSLAKSDDRIGSH